MRKFKVEAWDGRILDHQHETLAGLQDALTPKDRYKVVGEVLDGFTVSPPLPDGLPRYTYVTHLLLRHEEELLEWLEPYIKSRVEATLTEAVPASVRQAIRTGRGSRAGSASAPAS